MSALFVTGTDTGVGKTFVACALATALRQRGRRVAVMKPVETGVEDEPADALALRAAAADPAPLDDICPYRLRAPLAPAVAARLEGVTIDVARLVALVARRRQEADLLLVEGAGGLLVPLDAQTTWAELAVRTGLPLLIVGANRLGTVNHCALTARVAAAAGLVVHGFVLSQPAVETDTSAATNADTIATLTGLPCLGVLPSRSRRSRAAEISTHAEWSARHGEQKPGATSAAGVARVLLNAQPDRRQYRVVMRDRCTPCARYERRRRPAIDRMTAGGPYVPKPRNGLSDSPKFRSGR